MKELLQKINNGSISTQDRLNALEHFISQGGLKDYNPITKEINNHIHTMYSFSPYTPSMAALRAREAGLAVAGSVDHDSLEAASEMTEACKLLGLLLLRRRRRGSRRKPHQGSRSYVRNATEGL